MPQIFWAVVAVLFGAALVGAYLLLVVSDVRGTRGDPQDADGQRSLDAHEQRDGQRRVNRGAGNWM
ncbi:hypothetical protein [Nocardioides currus]|uniref:Uncharacterized protein n=1 Tax=Nocardioides currus TaxID=2133958 RepID=A0A2R7YYE3_9ACTN|nr:hypothetical protein [Nocardioides currus]PUA81400.1 hypothetical protein C7S10_10335 [Nocardioides currus]